MISVKSSIGKKQIVAVTGLILSLYVIVHLAGNLQIFLGPDAINAYAEKLKSVVLVLWGARAVLLAAFVTHIFLSIKLAAENRSARPQGYAMKKSVEASFASRTMILSGLLLLAFVIFHLAHFTWFGVNPAFAGLHDAQGRHDVYSMVVSSFQDPKVSAAYVAALFVLALHLSHGLSSLFQTFGLTECGGSLKCLRHAGTALAWLLFMGYCSIPAACLLGWVKLS